jgi:hypothetical protein
VPSPYRIASPFLIRLAGVPFDSVEQLATAEISRTARELLACEATVARCRTAAEAFVTQRNNGLAPEEFNAWRNAIRRGETPEQQRQIPEQLRDYAAAADASKRARLQLDSELQCGVANARRELFETSAQFLPAYLLFGSGHTHHVMELPASGEELPPRNSRARERERHLLLYLQRIAAKNDTFSEFGPSAWGYIVKDGAPLRFHATPGVARREAFLERWTAHAVAAAINADPDAFFEFRPRLNANGRVADGKFILIDSGECIQLTSQQLEILRSCDGKTSVREMPRIAEVIRELAAKKVLITAMEVPAMEPFAFEILRRDICAWSAGAVRERWLPVVTELSTLASRFAGTVDPSHREKILIKTREQLANVGAQRETGGRALYAAVNPIAEECSREVHFELSQELLDEVVTDAEPWIDFWHDSYAFIAARVAANLRALFEKAATKNSAMPLPAFLRFCEGAKIPLTGPGLVGMAHIAFQEVKAAFRERLRPHAESSEYELTAEDCAVVRQSFAYPKFDEFTYPSADLQLAAESAEAVNGGAYRWIIGELHPPAAALHHCMFWSCPDQPALSRALQSMIGDKPLCHFGFFAADFTAHTTVRVFDALPEHSVFISPQRHNQRWRCVAPGEVEVFVDEEGDVALRCNGEYLGSFARNWVIPLGFHPFLFTMGPHTPRLRCGRVVVQRRAWTVSAKELGGGNFSGISRDLVVAIERLRAAKDWPRFIYIRPSEQALRRSGAENRDKDTKPVFIDLESYLFLEIFHRWLTKAGELEVTEMLPAPDELLWREGDGRRTFELRTLLCPRKETDS